MRFFCYSLSLICWYAFSLCSWVFVLLSAQFHILGPLDSDSLLLRQIQCDLTPPSESPHDTHQYRFLQVKESHFAALIFAHGLAMPFSFFGGGLQISHHLNSKNRKSFIESLLAKLFAKCGKHCENWSTSAKCRPRLGRLFANFRQILTI